MYCGDETGSFIGDVGSHTCRFGYGGEDNPKLVMPSFVTNKDRMALSTLSLSESDTATMEGILRMPEYSTSSNDGSGTTSQQLSAGFPLTDPNAFLRQGDSIENWDNLQVAWETSMDVLRARDTLKHTRGGTPYPSSNKTRRHAGGSSSSTVIPSSSSQPPSDGGGRCVHPILAITPGFTEFHGYGRDYCAALRRQQYVQYTELLMESLDASAMFLAPAPMLSAFSLGRQTALIVDVGAGGCRVTPVVDGLILKHSQRRNGRGGDWLGNVTWRALLDESIEPKPRYLLRKRGGPSSDVTDPTDGISKSSSSRRSSLFHVRAMNDLMYEIRTEPFITLHALGSPTIRVPFTKTPVDSDVTMASPSSSMAIRDGITTSYKLPDGSSIDLSTPFGKDLCQLPELLFSDRLPFSNAQSAAESQPLALLPTMSTAPLHQLVRSSLLAVGDVDSRKELAGCICLTGATSLLPNIDARLSQELAQILPAFVRPKVLSSRISVEKSSASWIGASILTSLGSFQQLWLSKAEYDEYGTALAIQRFP